ncbi:ribosome biogenesis GTPase YlqF [Gammaproteobacteria bacterium]|nr:ribosome biogenesis GTPase YlqF [Gammaproteobacteria bacterium]
MPIGWYPGHMNKARKDITKTIARVDAVIEIVDARLPYSSENPLIHTIMGATPRLKVLNKADLADPEVTRQWLNYYQENNIKAVALEKTQTSKIRELATSCYREFKKPEKRRFSIMILGIPNVGKSTLMNILLDKKVAKVGNEPAVTKTRQEIELNESISLLDTPGILWPKIEDQNSAYRLAATGAIKNTAIEFEDIALYTVEFLRDHYPALLQERYQLESLDEEPVAILEQIGSKRGCLRKGGVDFTKTGEVLLNDLRTAKIGLISFEKPEEILSGTETPKHD